MRRVFHRHATPAFWLRAIVLHRCEAGPWSCWRRPVVDWPLAACERHQAEYEPLGQALLALRQEWRAEFDREAS